MTRSSVRFLPGDVLQEVGGIDPTITALDWLRLHKGLNDTKEGCAEGDCGAGGRLSFVAPLSLRDRARSRGSGPCG